MKKTGLIFMLLLSIGTSFCNCSENTTSIGNNGAISNDTVEYNGIDVSHHQKEIDWNTLSKNKDIQYVYIKASEGATYTDPNYESNKAGAMSHNIKFGAYHYYRTTSTVKEQFDNFIKLYPKEIAELRPMLDVENCGNLTKEDIQKNVSELSDLMEKYYGAKPLIYSVNTTYNKYLAPKFNDHILYIGRYGTTEPAIKGNTENTKIIWQYSEKGKIDGIKKTVDFSIFWKNITMSDLYIK